MNTKRYEGNDSTILYGVPKVEYGAYNCGTPFPICLKAVLNYLVLDGELRETQTANYFSDVYPIDCTVSPANALFCRKNGTLLQAGNLL